ncbi:MAG: signal peptide peptidase SppA [candidate division WOR-3 bacterium]|nr:MAG: signal peptide peptidase SppA [candidate division WOR-3 bacterium]
MMSLLFAGVLVSVAPQMPLSVATTDDALAVFANPAGLGMGRKSDFYYLYTHASSQSMRNHAVAANIGPLGAFWEPGSRFGFALGGGEDDMYAGIRVVRDSLTRFDLGALWRPWNYLSFGATWNDLGHDWGYVIAGAAVRPMWNRLTFSVDFMSTSWPDPIVGLETEPVDGLSIAARVRPRDMSFNAGLVIGLGNLSVGAVGTRVGSEVLDQVGGFVRVGVETRRSLVPKPKRFLELELKGRVADTRPGFSLMGSRPRRTTWQLLDLISDAKKDPGINGMLLKVEGFSAGFSQLSEIRAALADFRASGKQVVVYAPYLGVGSFYLASVADKVVGHPLGDVHIAGVSIQTLLLKGGLDKLGLKVDYQRRGKYKSAVETVAADSTSPENREQIEAFVDAVYDEFVGRSSEGLGMSRARFEEHVEHGFFMAHEAKQAGLIDTFCYDDELDDLLKEEIKGFRKVTEKRYLQSGDFEYGWKGPPRVAVVYASGSIASGESRTDFLTGDQTMGAKTMVRAIRAARRDKRVKAIVLRVDSPGGSGYASDIIWRELELTKEDKPVVASMGNIAGSGGYYIACGADRVFVNPTTLTGSIGVFGLKFVTEGLYNKLGIRRETFKRGERADALSDSREYTAEEDSILQLQVDWFYKQFVDKVAQGRGLSFEQVDSVAQGRIWAGTDAFEVGLVDSVGGLLAAIDWAKQQAGLEECELDFYPKPKRGFGPMARDLIAEYVLGLE